MSDDEQLASSGKMLRPKRIYLKDVSFETPNSPEIFTKKWDPDLTIDIQSRHSLITVDTYEVVLDITATVTNTGATAFLIEVHQAGIFIMKGYTPDELDQLHNVYCVKTLYPYACATITELVSKGGFPQLLLAPINFLAEYRKRLNQAEPQSGREQKQEAQHDLEET